MSKVVMLVEDEMFVALDIEMTLSEAGFQVDGPYATLEQALTALDARLPDCAILDVQLRDGEVFPAAERLRDAGVPIIFHSGHADAPLLGKHYPQAAVCSKPCAPSALQRAIARALADDPEG